MSSKILSIETAVPQNCWSQQEVLKLIKRKLKAPSNVLNLYERFLLDDAIQQRHYACIHPEELIFEDPDSKIRRFQEQALALAVEAFTKVLKTNDLEAKEIDALFISTCTGYLCPGLTSYVIE